MNYNIEDLTKKEILNKKFLPQVYENYPDVDERNKILKEVLSVAKKENCFAQFKANMQKYEKQQNLYITNNIIAMLSLGIQGEPEPTIDNYYNVIVNDDNIINHIRFNKLTNKFEYWEKDKCREWRDKDDAWLLSYIESTYGFYSLQKYELAKNKSEDNFSYHPIKDIIEKQEWDGIQRIDRFLTDICKTSDDDYSRELSRMIFYGGINRLYHPGCKFDYMVILMGSQGIGKSSIVDWLSLKTDFYREVISIDGSKGIESITGGWICEFAELLAMIRAKEVESLKGYITRLYDTYRPAYGRNVISLPRQCIFIGTTNDFQFLVDKTGNRRYLPIELHVKRGELFKHETYIRNYILECWREAKYLMDNNKTYMVIPSEYNDIIEKYQGMATDDDPKVGMITDYLEKKTVGDKVCGQEIFVNCCNGLKKNYTSRDGREIGIIMRRFPEWKRVDNPQIFDEFGKQKYWVKQEKPDEYDDEIKINRIVDLS